MAAKLKSTLARPDTRSGSNLTQPSDSGVTGARESTVGENPTASVDGTLDLEPLLEIIACVRWGFWQRYFHSGRND